MLANGDERRAKYIITTPNATWLPDISVTRQDVKTRDNGRYGDHDFTLWPQWYFKETRHLAFVPSKPANLPGLPRAVLWHELKTSDFDYEPGTVFTDLGKVSNDLLEKVMDIRRSVTSDISTILESSANFLTPIERYILEQSVVNMKLSSVCLTVAPQTYFATLCTFTLFQRYALEAIGCFDLVNQWSKAKALATGQFAAPLNLNNPVVGAITSHVDVAVDLASLGIPVWLVRPPHSVNASTTKVVNTTDPIQLSGVATVLRGPQDSSRLKFSGPPSPARNRASLCVRLGHLHLGAYTGLQSAQPSVNTVVTAAPPGEFPSRYNAAVLTFICYT